MSRKSKISYRYISQAISQSGYFEWCVKIYMLYVQYGPTPTIQIERSSIMLRSVLKVK